MQLYTKKQKDLVYIGFGPTTKKPLDRTCWYTPKIYIESSRKVLEGIDLDPFSDELANRVVKAKKYFTEEDNAFFQHWNAKSLFMNPPYTKGIIDMAVEKLLINLNRGDVHSAIVLTFNCTETNWCQDMFSHADACCFVNKRIKFVSLDKKASSSPPRGNIFFYFGDNKNKFEREFQQYGKILCTKRRKRRARILPNQEKEVRIS